MINFVKKFCVFSTKKIGKVNGLIKEEGINSISNEQAKATCRITS